MFVAHYTGFGRAVTRSAATSVGALMGLPVDRTKMLVYMLNGFCSALAGIAYSIYVGSGHGTHATGFELTVIAAVVIGGTALTGGEGYLLGSLFGVLITALIQSLIQFNGQLSSWWTSIVIGALMLVFIGVQSLLSDERVLTLSRAAVTGPGDGSGDTTQEGRDEDRSGSRPPHCRSGRARRLRVRRRATRGECPGRGRVEGLERRPDEGRGDPRWRPAGGPDDP
jgi:hypothetical protein